MGDRPLSSASADIVGDGVGPCNCPLRAAHREYLGTGQRTQVGALDGGPSPSWTSDSHSGGFAHVPQGRSTQSVATGGS